MLDILNIDISKLIHIKSVYRYTEKGYYNSDVVSSHSENSSSHFLFYENKLLYFSHKENDAEIVFNIYKMRKSRNIFEDEYLLIFFDNEKMKEDETYQKLYNYMNNFEYEKINQKIPNLIDDMFNEVNAEYFSLVRKNKIKKILLQNA